MTVSHIDGAVDVSVPVEKVERHSLADRLYHWLMALAVLTLMATAFLPKVGIKFPWVNIHWVTGIGLTALVLIHIVRALFFQDFRAMVTGGKYSAAQKLYHWGIAVFLLAVIGTGLTMTLKVETPFFKRDPYILPFDTWGWIYSLHGLAAMFALMMVMIHIYFGVRPDDWHLLRSMVRGWITRKEYEEHFDRSRWTPPPADR